MYDEEIGAELRRLAAQDPGESISGAAMLRRGRRGRMRRRVAAAGTAVVVASVAAVVTAGVVARLGPDTAPGGEAQVAGSASASVEAGMFQPLPGVPHGDAALGQLDRAEAVRRCVLRYPGAEYPAGDDTRHRKGYRAGSDLVSVDATGATPTTCMVPGDSRPTAAAVDLAESDPLPKSQTGQLHNCSVMFWHDFSNWEVVASEQIDGVGASLLAKSPSGKYVVNCQLNAHTVDVAAMGSGPAVIEVKTASPQPPASLAGMVGFQSCSNSSIKCVGWVFPGGGRVDPKITRIRIEAANGKSHELTVKDVWFALYWADGNPKGQPGAAVTAYDRNGAVVR